LKEFLARTHLFSTAQFRERYEAQARRNLQHSLLSLEGLGAAGV
jgi:predicted metal-dependent HD superfamily phosphohydrolase